MTRYFLFASLMLLLVSGSVSCKDKDNKKSYCTENPGSCQSVLAAKEFFLFKEGSWWVYEEETSHERDSLYVTEYYNSDGYDFDMRVHSSLSDYNYHYWPLFTGSSGCSATSPIHKKCIFINRSKGKPGDYIGESQCFFVNYKQGDYETTGSDLTYCPNNKIIVEQVYSNYQLGNFNFGKTVKIGELCSFIEGAQPTKNYYSSQIGLVSKELLDSNQVWNLISYHIAL